MKKLIAILVAALFICGAVYAATPGRDLSPGVGDKQGMTGFPWEGNKTFRLVRYMPQSGIDNADCNTLTKDSIVIWDTTSADGCTITTTTTSHDARVAGVIVQNALTPETLGKAVSSDVAGRSWTWLQTYGRCEIKIPFGGNGSNNISAVGRAIGTSTTAGMADAFLASTSVGVANGNAGFAMSVPGAGTIGTDFIGFLKCE